MGEIRLYTVLVGIILIFLVGALGMIANVVIFWTESHYWKVQKGIPFDDIDESPESDSTFRD